MIWHVITLQLIKQQSLREWFAELDGYEETNSVSISVSDIKTKTKIKNCCR